MCWKEEKHGGFSGPGLKVIGTSADISLANTWSHGHTKPQGNLGYVAYICYFPGIIGNSFVKHLAVSATSNQRL